MKLLLSPLSTQVITHIYIQNSITSQGQTGLTFADITAYYVRSGGVLTALTMETITTLGTWAVSGDDKMGFKLLHDTNAPGLYEIHLPENLFDPDTHLKSFVIQLRATGVWNVQLEMQVNYPDVNAVMLNGITPSTTLLNNLADDWANGGRLDLIADGIEAHVHATDGHITADYGSTEKAAIDLLDDAKGIVDIHDTLDLGLGIGFATATDSLKALSTQIDTINWEADDIYSDVEEIISDTNELQTDLHDGGRLDNLLDAIDATIDDVLTNMTLFSGPGFDPDEDSLSVLSNNLDALAAIVDDIHDVGLPDALTLGQFLALK